MMDSMKFISATAAAAILFALAPASARSAVVDSSAGGFTIKTTMTIQAKPEEVYQRLLRIGDWWESAHTYSGDAHNLSIEEKPMGCFCERLPGQGGVRHMEVVYFAPGKRLVMIGGLGPLQSMGAAGSLTIEIAPAEDGVKLEYTYAVGGYLPAGMNTLAPVIDTVLGRQFARFKNYVEHGNPAPAQK
jgi:uncharacterized protein YndB with AHSA1/START domain